MYPENFGQLEYSDNNKKVFLSKSASLLRSVAKMFPEYTCKVSKNAGGIAVGGDVYLSINGPEKGVMIAITHSPISSKRKDGVLCYVQVRLPDTKGNFTVIPIREPNRYLNNIEVDSIYAQARALLAA